MTRKFAVAIMAVALCPLLTFAGHDTEALCILEKMPSEWRARFKSEWMKPYLEASHLPDHGRASLLRAEDIEWLAANCGFKGDMYALHNPPCLIGETARLVHAIRTGDDYSVFMYLASISHSILDPVACNHDPIIHLFLYIWCPSALNVIPSTGRSLPSSFDFAAYDADTREVLARRLAALKVPAVPKDITAESLFTQMLSWRYSALDKCSATTQRIIENGTKWMLTGDAKAKREVADAHCDLGLWAVVRTLYVFDAARRLAAKGEIDVTPESI